MNFEQKIWSAADILCGNMDAAGYKHAVLGLIFLRFISDNLGERYQGLLSDDEVTSSLVPPEARWSFIAKVARTRGDGTGQHPVI
ncbi:MAG: SAM-dependent DNA methyltransferase [Synergistaceae bacterium]|nr:SAM-dependent DNA methyltransferase [Synergistaceae bacterium]